MGVLGEVEPDEVFTESVGAQWYQRRCLELAACVARVAALRGIEPLVAGEHAGGLSVAVAQPGPAQQPDRGALAVHGTEQGAQRHQLGEDLGPRGSCPVLQGDPSAAFVVQQKPR